MIGRTGVHALSAIVTIGSSGYALCQSTVHLRGGGSVESAELVFSEAGVQLTLDGATRTLPWHRVRLIDGDGSEAWRGYRDLAEDAWRGLARLERGDPYAAEPPLSRAFERLRDSRSESTALIAEGLLDCRLRLGKPSEAIEPWLTALACYAEGVWAGPGPASPIDANTLLVPSLMPALLRSELDRSSFTAPVTGSGRVGAIGSIMAHAFGDDSSPAALPDPAADVGQRLLAAVVGTMSQDSTARGVARKALADLSAQVDSEWMRAWCDAGIGVSLLSEGTSSQEAAIGYLLRVAVLIQDTHPDLAGLALGEAVEGLLDLGRVDQARRLAGELRSQDAGHAALARPRVRALLQDSSATSRQDGESSL